MSSAKGLDVESAIGKHDSGLTIASSSKAGTIEPYKGGISSSADLSGLLGCKKVLDNSNLDNQTKLIKLVTDHELGQTIKQILAEGEV